MEFLGYLFLAIIIIYIVGSISGSNGKTTATKTTFIRTKYPLLVKLISELEDDYSTFTNSDGSITISKHFQGGYSRFEIYEEFNRLVQVMWYSKNSLGQQSLNWQFLSSIHQGEMFNNILVDLKQEASKLLNDTPAKTLFTTKSGLYDKETNLRAYILLPTTTTNLSDFQQQIEQIKNFYLKTAALLYHRIEDIETLNRVSSEINKKMNSSLTLAFKSTNPNSRAAYFQHNVFKEVSANISYITSKKLRELTNE